MNQETLDCIKGQRVCRYSNYKDTELPPNYARLNYGDLKSLHTNEATDTDFLTPELLSGSDYCSSSSVEVSNHRVFLAKYGKLPNVYDVYGGYGTFSVAIRLDSITPEMIEDLNALEDYPVLDEDDLGEVESETEQESWDSFVRSDFIQELTKKFPGLDLTDLSNDRLDILFYNLMDRTNTYWEHEAGNTAFIRLKNMVESATEQDITEAS